MKAKKILFITLIFFLFSSSNILRAQQWQYYNPTLWLDVNSVEILGPGIISIGGGWETNDSIQVMFQTKDYGLTWNENSHDGPAPWNKSIAFSDSLNGYGVGYDGRIIKTDDAGLNWGWPSTPTSRDLNKIFYVSNGTYYLVGGTKTNDSVQTIIKSNNYGDTWNVIYETAGFWLKSVYFFDTLKGIVVGDNGVILSTPDGGTSWTSISSPLLRDFNGITFINSDTGYIVGGTETGLCKRTILQTTDGGINWSVILDITGGILKDISFANNLVGYTVGDSATVLKTTDGGINWMSIIINTNLTGNESFNAVKFYNKNFGVIGGKAGAVYVYYNPFPKVFTSFATHITTSSAKLNGTLDANGIPTSVKFEYGPTTAYGSEIDAIPDSSAEIGSIEAHAFIAGLTPNTTYHFRIIGANSDRTNYGNDIPFYTGPPEIPNFDFEIWDTTNVELPDGWSQGIGLISKYSPGCNGDFAVRIQNPPNGDIGAITIGCLGDGIFGGLPFNARPDTLVGCFKYDIELNDTAWVGLILKKNGNAISMNINKIAGSSGGDFVTLKFPIQYETSDIPDTLMMLLSSSNLENKTPLPNSWIVIDDLYFTGTTLNIPNNSFEQWHRENLITLKNWNYKNREVAPSDSVFMGLLCTTDAESNKYAIKLKSNFSPNGNIDGVVKSGNYFTDRIPVNNRHQTFTGFFKYFPQNNDTMRVSIKMFKNGNNIGNGDFFQGNTVETYTPFVTDIIYSSQMEVPDSMSINIQTYKSWPPNGNSVAYIDYLNFDGFLSGIKETPIMAVDNFDFNVYPNPFSEQTTVSFTLNKEENVAVRLFDLSGKQVALLADGKYKSGNYKIDLSAEGLQKGFLICVIYTESKVLSKKLIVY